MSIPMTFTIDYDPREEERAAQNAIYDDLNPAQQEAVLATDGPVLVLAGAGTGKTRVLTTRIAHLLAAGRATYGQILAVTFTNKAAKEMEQRVGKLLEPRTIHWLGTFHSLAARMLRSHAGLVGLDSNFTILDADDQVRLCKQLLEEHQIDPKKNPPKAVADIISSWKDKGKIPSDIKANEVGDFANGKMLVLYTQYQQRMKVLNACDFGDLLLHIITILKDPKNASVLEDYHRRFKYILVDEYQDTNVAQYLWLRLLAKGSNNICCVGDDDQSIYGWRGAEVDNILRFEKDFEGAKIVRLEQNYRSTGHILAAANGVIDNNSDRLGKQLFTAEGDGEKLTVRGLWDGAAEARWVGEEVESLQNKGIKLNQMAVLVRNVSQMRQFDDRFALLGISCRIIGGPRLYERRESRDALAYLRVIAQENDDLAFERIINTPKRGIGDSTVKTLYQHARRKNISLYASVRDLTQTEELKPAMRGKLMKLIDNFERWKSLANTTHHGELMATVLDESGYNDMWKKDKAPDAPGRLENLKELVSAMADFESLQEFLEHVALVLDNQSNKDGEFITLMTLHGSKGLEYDVVFLPGWEEELFPSQRSMDERGVEEERRLAYVGITRARKKSFISCASSRFVYGSLVEGIIPSRFVCELLEDHIELQDESGVVQAIRSRYWDSSGFNQKPQVKTYETREQSTVDGEFTSGMRVFHDKFGNGTIVHIDGSKLDINFDQAGQKRVMDSFVQKA